MQERKDKQFAGGISAIFPYFIRVSDVRKRYILNHVANNALDKCRFSRKSYCIMRSRKDPSHDRKFVSWNGYLSLLFPSRNVSLSSLAVLISLLQKRLTGLACLIENTDKSDHFCSLSLSILPIFSYMLAMCICALNFGEETEINMNSTQ